MTMTNEEINALPFTNDRMPLDEFMQWVETRKDAGAAIDIATCEIASFPINRCNPYWIPGHQERYPDCYDAGLDLYVRGLDSHGWISEDDLPSAKYDAVRKRYAAERLA
jgi:hypothetical protein